MKKALIGIVIVSFLFATGCKQKTVENPADKKYKNENNIKMLTIADDYYARSGADTDSGYYEVISYETHCNLVYTDYIAKQQIFVCSAPQCLHDDDECTSYIKNPFTVFLDYKGENITYITYDIIDEIGKKYAIYQMDLNGENKIKLYEFEQKYDYDGGMIAADKNTMYFVVSEITDKYKKILVSVDIKKGIQQTVTELDDSELLLSAKNDILYFVSADEENSNSVLAFNLTNNTKQKIYALKKPNIKEELVAGKTFTFANYLEIFCILKDVMYVYDKTNGQIRAVDLVSLNEKIIGKIEKERETYFTNIIDTHIIIRQINVDEKKETGFAVDVATEQISQLTLLYTEEDRINTVIPVAINEDFIIAQLGYFQEEVTLKGPSNIPYTAIAKVPKRALIKTENYLQGIEEYFEIDDKSLMLPIK